ncbi:MAG: hypothetical protein FWH29_09970 [Methanobrevibacter sp.]|nr:hypothetical protein [Methanobrevibacter sp.]
MKFSKNANIPIVLKDNQLNGFQTITEEKYNEIFKKNIHKKESKGIKPSSFMKKILSNSLIKTIFSQ